MNRWRNMTPEQEAELARREEEERREAEDLRRRQRFASDAGFHFPKMSDPVQFYVCPTCGATVLLDGVERHAAWHGQP